MFMISETGGYFFSIQQQLLLPKSTHSTRFTGECGSFHSDNSHYFIIQLSVFYTFLQAQIPEFMWLHENVSFPFIT